MPQDVAGVMREFSEGKLHSGASDGPVVKNRKQAIAIGLGEQRKMDGSSKRVYAKAKKKTRPKIRRAKDEDAY